MLELTLKNLIGLVWLSCCTSIAVAQGSSVLSNEFVCQKLTLFSKYYAASRDGGQTHAEARASVREMGMSPILRDLNMLVLDVVYGQERYSKADKVAAEVSRRCLSKWLK